MLSDAGIGNKSKMKFHQCYPVMTVILLDTSKGQPRTASVSQSVTAVSVGQSLCGILPRSGLSTQGSLAPMGAVMDPPVMTAGWRH